jgi:glycine cleavage system H lipoate-binding protein
MSRFSINGKALALQALPDGGVVARNDELLARPDLVNDDPYERGCGAS